jgi:CheY-like chemotaxis protein
MVLDEDAGIRQALSLVLDDAGYEVLSVGDADVAAALLRRSRDCVVVLFDVPGVRHAGRENPEAFARVAAEPSLAARHAFICMTTSVQGLPPSLRLLLLSRGIPVLAKPFDIELLLQTVAQVEGTLACAAAVYAGMAVRGVAS